MNIKRQQVPVESGFVMTAHKARGRTMDRVVADLASCSGTEQLYVMTSGDGDRIGVVVRTARVRSLT